MNRCNKALATQTGKATREIGAQISGMQAATQDAVSSIKEIGGTINQIAEIAGSIAAAIEEQGAATAEIARNVQQAAQGTTQVTTNITEVNRGAGETGLACSQMLASAQSLAGESNRLEADSAGRALFGQKTGMKTEGAGACDVGDVPFGPHRNQIHRLVAQVQVRRSGSSACISR